MISRTGIDKGRRRKIEGQHKWDGAIIHPELNCPRARCSRSREITIFWSCNALSKPCLFLLARAVAPAILLVVFTVTYRQRRITHTRRGQMRASCRDKLTKASVYFMKNGWWFLWIIFFFLQYQKEYYKLIFLAFYTCFRWCLNICQYFSPWIFSFFRFIPASARSVFKNDSTTFSYNCSK